MTNLPGTVTNSPSPMQTHEPSRWLLAREYIGHVLMIAYGLIAIPFVLARVVIAAQWHSICTRMKSPNS